jgi:hypothetical protein
MPVHWRTSRTIPLPQGYINRVGEKGCHAVNEMRKYIEHERNVLEFLTEGVARKEDFFFVCCLYLWSSWLVSPG